MTSMANGSARNGALTPREMRRLVGPVLSNQIDPAGELLFGSFNGGTVFEVANGDARDMRDMLARDGTSRSLEQVITLPLRGADWEIRAIDGDRGEAEFVRDQLGDRMADLLGWMTGACLYRKAFHEVSWDLDAGRVVLADLGWRPPQACEAAFDARTGQPDGFRKAKTLLGGLPYVQEAVGDDPDNPGHVRIPAGRSFIYTHGTHREPLTGVSDMDVPHWAWNTQQKIMFLWFQFLENTSLPKTVVYGPDVVTAQRNAEHVSMGKASSVVPMERQPGDNTRPWDMLESSGRGADQFLQALRYLDGRKTQALLASFTELAAQATDGRGSNALSMDQSEFYLVSRQAVADEMAGQVNNDLIRRMVRWNFGSQAKLPYLKIGPLSRRNTDRALEMLGNVITSPKVNAPPEFTDMLLTSTASYLGLDTRKLEKAVEEKRRADEATEQQRPAEPGKDGDTPDAELGDVVNLAHQLVRRTTAGEDPQNVLNGLATTPPARRALLSLASPSKRKGAEQERKTGGMVALVPDADSARRLAVTGSNAEHPEHLHATVVFLGEDVTGWDTRTAAAVVAAARAVAAALPGEVEARAWSHATFNPDGGPDGTSKPCAVYLIGGTPLLQRLHTAMATATKRVLGDKFHEQHSPYAPHVTAGYGMTAADLSYAGPVRFNRLVITLAGDTTTIPLGRSGEDTLELANWSEGDHPRIPKGMPGGGRFTSGTPDLRRVLMERGGFTYDPRAQRTVEIGERAGFAVAVPGTERVLGADTMTQDEFRAVFRGVMRDHADAINQGAYVGGWRSPDRGLLVVELSEIHDVSRADAERLGRSRNQEAILDMLTGDEISTGGTGG